MNLLKLSLYLHIPFCIHRCGYCDFNTYAGLQDLIPDYGKALCAEIAYLHASLGERAAVHTVYFGGGTPSLLPVNVLEQIMAALDAHFQISAEAEITMEANPGTLSLDYLRAVRRLGLNRLSIGMQSGDPGELSLLDRQHNLTDVIQSVSWACQAGFNNQNLDLIFGLPGQSVETWQGSLELALELRPEHFSLYALTLEPGTPLNRQVAQGIYPHPDPDLAAEMYEWAAEKLAKSGYAQYEISNWAQEGFACKHNIQYWRNLPYLGLGAGAHGYAAGVRTIDVHTPARYIQRMQAQPEGAHLPFPRTPATLSTQVIDRQAEIGETMMMGLRLVEEGVSSKAFQERFGVSLEALFGKQIERLTRLGLLEWAGNDGDILRLTSRGRLLGNQVFVEFV